MTVASRSVRAPVSMRLAFTPSSVAVARRTLRTFMRDAGASAAAVEDARVVVSELVANSVRHARPLDDGQLDVSWVLEERGLLLSVTDGGSGTSAHAVDAPSSALAGRGMAIVGALAAEWWTERTGSRSTVHALLHL